MTIHRHLYHQIYVFTSTRLIFVMQLRINYCNKIYNSIGSQYLTSLLLYIFTMLLDCISNKTRKITHSFTQYTLLCNTYIWLYYFPSNSNTSRIATVILKRYSNSLRLKWTSIGFLACYQFECVEEHPSFPDSSRPYLLQPFELQQTGFSLLWSHPNQ